MSQRIRGAYLAPWVLNVVPGIPSRGIKESQMVSNVVYLPTVGNKNVILGM